MSQFTDESIYDPPDPGTTYFCFEHNSLLPSDGFTLLMKWVMMVKFHPELHEEIRKIDKNEINKWNTKGFTALHLACYNVDHGSTYEVIELLLQLGANPNQTCTHFGSVPLADVCSGFSTDKDFHLVKLLIKHNSDINFVNSGGANLLMHLLSSIDLENVEFSSILDLFRLLEIDEKKILHCDDLPCNALSISCSNTSFRIFDHMLSLLSEETKKNLKCRKLRNFQTYLHQASMNSHPEGYKIVEKLLDLNFDINALDSSGNKPYYYANVFAFKNKLNSGWARVINRLQPDVDYKESLFTYVEHSCANVASVKHMDELIAKGADLHHVNADGFGLLHWVINLNHCWHQCDLIKHLIGMGLDVDAQTRDLKYTSLMIATAHGNYNQVETLLNENADINICDISGWNALEHAVSCNNYEIADLLLRYGADPNSLSTSITSTILSDSRTRKLLDSYGKVTRSKMAKPS